MRVGQEDMVLPCFLLLVPMVISDTLTASKASTRVPEIDEDVTAHLPHQAPLTCLETEFGCHDGKQCILQRWQCDSDEDCEDGSDEAPAICSAKTCNANQFSCGQAGMCIPRTWRCDKQKDCPDGSDETNCSNVTCSSDEFSCDNSKCITAKWHCDHDNDCGDMSDETYCPTATCLSSEFQCNTTKCIPSRWRCDGDIDCHDESDETDCPLLSSPSRCSENEFTCKSGDCIHKSWQCDTDADCHDHSDEEGCGEETCGPQYFTCMAKNEDGRIECIPGYKQCDGISDCGDLSDEDDCPIRAKVCDIKTQFDCQKDGQNCISLEKVCDQVNDCRSAEDETSELCSREHEDPCLKDNGNCSQLCHNNINGFYCSCYDGYCLDSSNKTCIDIDECLIEGTCSHICENSKGGYKCTCYEGYYIDPAQHHFCKAGGNEPSLMFANRRDVREFKIHSHDYFNLVGNQKSAVSLDYDYNRGRLYWSDVAEGSILATNLTGNHHGLNTNAEVIAHYGIRTPDGIALDWVHNNLYWTDTGNDRIEVIDLDTKERKILIDENLDEPRALVVDPRDKQGFIYWTDWGQAAKIEKAGMDGTHRKAIIETAIKWPNGLAIDYASNHLYWVDARLHLISRSDLEGFHQKVILTTNHFLHHPFALAVFEDSIFWTDWETESVHTVEKFNATVNKVKTLVTDLITPMDIHAYHPLKQPAAASRCEINGGCSHLCLPSPYITSSSAIHSCHCPVGVKLDMDMRTCLIPETTIPPTTSATTKIRDVTEGERSSSSSSGLIVLIVIPIIILKIAFWACWCYFRCCRRNVVIVRRVIQVQAPANGNNIQQLQPPPISSPQQPPSYAYATSAGPPPPYGQQLGQPIFPNLSPVAAPVMMGGMKKTPEAPSSIPVNPNNRLDQPMEDTRIGVPDDEQLISRV